MTYRSAFALACCLIPGILTAQDFRYKAKLPPATQTGFYRVTIVPEISAHSQIQLEDLRLFDGDGKEIPYLLKKEAPVQNETAFINYPFTSTIEKNRQTLIIENKDKRRVDKFMFQMKNADASRLVRISGSDDRQRWYVVRDSFYLESYADENTSVIKKSLTFPGSDYAFYKIEIATGNQESPLNILNAGNYSTNTIEALYRQIPGISYTRTDSNKTTYIHVTCSPSNRIDKLTFSISAPEMFRRSILIRQDRPVPATVTDDYPASRYASRTVVSEYRSYEISSDMPNTIPCSDLLGYNKSTGFTVEINNHDDVPLTITGIQAYQLTTSITALLEKEKSYFLYFGDSMLTSPAYDIVYFESKIPENVPAIDPLSVQPKANKDKDEYSSSKDKYIVWIGLGLAGIIIFALTMSMMKKMKNG